MTVRHATTRNPFLLITDPDVVLAAIASSERLGQLERRLCRPLDRDLPETEAGTGDPAAKPTSDNAAGARQPA